MRRAGNLWAGVIERGNLVRAFHQAARGKRGKAEVRRFAADLDGNLERMRRELEERCFEIGRYHVFEVHDPKRRTIHAARFPERVFHHALMNVCEPVLERTAIFHSYACRRGKGRLAAVAAAQQAARHAAWHLKLDIRKYFDSVPHDRLLDRVRRVIKDPEVLHWLETILRSHHPETGVGLPIGSLTSQHLANFYLGSLDRHCQGLTGVTAYVRYMDDFVCWGGEKAALLAAGREIRRYAEQALGLALKHPPCPQATARGMDFLGDRLFPTHTVLNRRSKVRYRRRLRILATLHEAGTISEHALQQRLTAATAFVRPARSHGFRLRAMETIRSSAIGHEPGEPGRQLEQQRDQRPRREPQQQHAGQPQQQQRFPARPQLSPPATEGAGMSPLGLNRPPSCSPPPVGCDETTPRPPGAGSPAESGSNAPGGDFFPPLPDYPNFPRNP
jgi:RNA-directed DNA polymerase